MKFGPSLFVREDSCERTFVALTLLFRTESAGDRSVLYIPNSWHACLHCDSSRLPTFPRLLLSPACSDVGAGTPGLIMARSSRSRGHKYRKQWRVRRACRQSTHKGIAVQPAGASSCAYPTLNGEILVLYRVGGPVLGAAAAKV
jgi:hypothetical protein